MTPEDAAKRASEVTDYLSRIIDFNAITGSMIELAIQQALLDAVKAEREACAIRA